MNSSLAEAQPGRHLAHFHHHPDALADSAFEFLQGGLRRGNSVVIIASPENVERSTARLGQAHFNLAALQHAGQLTILDAETLLAEITLNGMPEWDRFRGTLTAILDGVRTFGRGTRIYADLAGMLWRDGNATAAIRLEDLWNALGRLTPFALFCGYMMDTHCEESYIGPLEELGRTHTEIVATNEDERFAAALDRASRELFGISLSQMVSVAKAEGERRFPTGQRTMLWVRRNLPLSTAQLAERARRYYNEEPRV